MNDRRVFEDQTTDEATTPDTTGWGQRATKPSPSQTGREPAIVQLEAIIESLTTYAAPVLREIAARAAELAAKAADAAGPIAHKAAEKTEEMSGRLATKGREVASDLRREPTEVAPEGDITPRTDSESPAAEEAGLPAR